MSITVDDIRVGPSVALVDRRSPAQAPQDNVVALPLSIPHQRRADQVALRVRPVLYRVR